MKEITEYQYNKLLNIPEARTILGRLEFDKSKIYIFKDGSYIYKLHSIGLEETKERYAWIDLETSNCWANGSLYESEVAEEINQPNVYVFDSIVEMCNWIIKKK